MDPYDLIAAYYDQEHAGFTEDIDLYLEHLPAGRVLEMGAGSGRLTEALARAGLEVWAVDRSDAMLQRARHRLGEPPHVHLIHADMVQLDLDITFTSAVFTLNTLWHVTDAGSQVDVLRVARRHLEDGGLLIADHSNPLTLADRRANGQVRQRYHGVSESQSLTIWSAAWDDEVEQTLSLTLHYDVTDNEGSVGRVSSDLLLRYVYRSELELMLQAAGFQVREVFGTYDEEEYGSESPNLILLAEAV